MGRKAAAKKKHHYAEHIQHRLWEGLLILIACASIFLFISLGTYHRSDPGWSHLINAHHVANSGGPVGAWVADLFLYAFGYLAYLFPVMFCYISWVFYLHKHRYHGDEERDGIVLPLLMLRTAGFLIVLGTGCALIQIHVNGSVQPMPFASGGVLGDVVGLGMLNTFNNVGATLILLTFFLIGMTLFTGLSWLRLIDTIGANVLWAVQTAYYWVVDREWTFFSAVVDRFRKDYDEVEDYSEEDEDEDEEYEEDEEEEEEEEYDEDDDDKPIISRVEPELEEEEPKQSLKEKLLSMAHLTKKKDAEERVEPDTQVEPASLDEEISKAMRTPPRFKRSNALPKLATLDKTVHDDANRLSVEDLEARSEEVEERLADFGVEASVVAVHPGPVVTRYEIDLAAGTKVSKISNLAKDLARSLSVTSVRIVEVIPGKSVIGIELPNDFREMVSLREVLASSVYKQASSPLTIALGKDIAGHPVIADLAKMPHLLVAGTTGSGKSVSLNAMLLSLLYKSTPDELRLILIDPKMLELSIYDGIPHLLTPVVTDMKDAATALRWCVVEMERRYRLMASLGVRNIAGYNTKVKQAKKNGTPLLDPITKDIEQIELQELPYIVVLADEFADMMVVVGKKVETLIARLAQKARAAGVHLIFATQRPSVDVITGLIKANIPTRIAFQVSQRVDSRTILDQQGAEQLLGNGDMLYLPPGSGLPVRVHGAFVSDDEVHRVVASLKEQGEPDYENAIFSDTASIDPTGYTDAASGEFDAEQDEYYDHAVEFIAKARRVSISSIQRRFKIGYNRAARIVEAMEAAGVVTKMEGNGSREVLVPPPRED